MPVYHVMLVATDLRIVFDGESVEGGFFKNEYVWARDADTAVAKARARVGERVAELQSTGAILNMGPVVLGIDEVNGPVAPWNVLRREGFIFFRAEPTATI
jgi:hypothetical protein